MQRIPVPSAPVDPPAGANVRRLAVSLLAVVGIVVLGDRITVAMTHRDWTLDRETVIALRLLCSLPILRYPLEGLVIAMEVDKWDWYWLAAGNQPEASQTIYQEWDKVLDLFPLAVALIATRTWHDPLMKRLSLGTYALRIFGVATFLATRQRWLMVAFPNVVENLLLMYMAHRLLTGSERMLTTARVLGMVLVAAALPKVVEEYFLHMLNRRPWDWVNLPLPDSMEPRLWIAGAYLPMFLVTIHLVRKRSAEARAPALSQTRLP